MTLEYATHFGFVNLTSRSTTSNPYHKPSQSTTVYLHLYMFKKQLRFSNWEKELEREKNKRAALVKVAIWLFYSSRPMADQGIHIFFCKLLS